MLADKLSKMIKQLWAPQERILVAVSTGVDSMVLLHILEQLEVEIGVVHINHGLRKISDEEEAFLTDYCQERKLPLYKTRWQQPATAGIEAAARDFRYAFFSQTMAQFQYDVLVTAHHADDQMETILMKLVREGNFFSSSGIRLTQTFGEGRLIRPLLEVTKAEILAYSQENQLDYFEDETNTSLAMQRNRLRHQVLPLLKQENPQASQHFQQWSQQMLWAQEIVQEQQTKWYREALLETKKGVQVAFDYVQQLTLGQRYYFFQGLGQRKVPIVLSEKQLQQILQLVEQGAAQWRIDLGENWEVRKSYQYLTIQQKDTQTTVDQEVQLTVGESCFLSETEWIGLFSINEVKIPEKVKLWSEYRQNLTLKFPFNICLRKRQPGDKIALTPQLQKKVRRFFIDQKIPSEEREKAWVVTDSQGDILGLLPFVFSYLSIIKETDKIHYVLLYKREPE